MENGDLRTVLRCLLPLDNPNCTYHMRLHADSRDPPLPTALHVSTLHGFGGEDKLGGGGGSAELGQVAADEPAHEAAFTLVRDEPLSLMLRRRRSFRLRCCVMSVILTRLMLLLWWCWWALALKPKVLL